MGEDMESSVHYADETGCKYDRRRCKVGNSRYGTLRRMFRAGFFYVIERRLIRNSDDGKAVHRKSCCM